MYDALVGPVHHWLVFRGRDIAFVDGRLQQVNIHARSRCLVPVAWLCRLVHHLAPHPCLLVLALFQSPAHLLQIGHQLVAFWLVFGQEVKDVCHQHGHPSQSLAPHLGRVVVCLFRPAGLALFSPAVVEQPVVLATELEDPLYLSGHFLEVLRMTERFGIPCEKDLSHEHTVHPYLWNSMGVVEHIVFVAGIVVETAPDGFRCFGISCLLGQLIHQQTGIARDEVVECAW